MFKLYFAVVLQPFYKVLIYKLKKSIKVITWFFTVN